MTCPHCGVDHKESSPCQPSTGSRTSNTKRIEEQHPMAGLDNPFWKPEKPAAASL